MSLPPRSFDLPARLGRYVLGDVIGVGGFAVVVRARDESLDADVAIKVLDSRHALDPELRERFVREARLLRRVRNPSVVTVHDVGETVDGRPFLVMDLADGGVLQDRLDATVVLPPDPSALHTIVTTLAEGLGALHAAGVIHRDVKPANLLVLHDRAAVGHGAGGPGRLLSPGERLVIGDLGLAKDQLATAIGPTMIGGSPRFQAPEQTELGAAVDARTDVYAATAVVWVVLTGRPAPTPDELPVALLDVAEEWRPVLARGLAEHPDGRFGSIAEWADAILAAGLVAPTAASRTASVAAAPAATLPYKGLAAYEPEDAPLFFGRGDMVDQLVARLQRRSTLVIGGPSGIGKSSVLRAGLLTALAGGALPGSRQWQVCLLTPGDRPLSALREQLARVHGESTFPSVEALRAEPELARRAVSASVLVAVDQLEELFTVCDDADERDAFLRTLSAVTSGAQPVARVVLAVRADFYGTCATYPWLADAINENQVLVGPMTRAQLRETIEGPARRVGLVLEDGLVDRVLTDAGGDAGALPLVAHALVETWLRREGNRLTVAGYEATGGVDGAIGRSADDVWEQLSPEQQRVARGLLLRLVHPGEGTPDTKRLLSWTEVGTDRPTQLVVSGFADSRLLTADEHGVQLAHEALLRSWGRLTSWLDESRDELRAGERIEDAAREWDRQGRHPDLLYRGVPLGAALEWRTRHDGVVGEPASSFLTAAEGARDAEERAASAREQRSRRIRRRALVTLATLTALALVTSGLAVAALGRSRRSARVARAANRLASEQLARGLAASALDLRTSNPFLATMLATEAIGRSNPPLAEARRALVESRIALAGHRLVPYGDPVPVGDALAVTVRPSGDLIATGNRDGTADIFDVARREQVMRLTGPGGGLQSLAFTADGRWLVGASADHHVWRWDIANGVVRKGALAGTVLADAKSIVWAVAAAPTGTTVAAATQRGEVMLLDAATGVSLDKPFDPQAGELMSVAFSPDGTTVLAGSGRGQLFAWMLSSGALRYPPVAAHTSHVWELAVRDEPEGPRVVTVSSDGTVRLWDLATGARVNGGPFDGATPSLPIGVKGVTLAPAGDVLILGGPDGALYAWDLAGKGVVDKGGPVHRGRVTGAAQSSDGQTIVTLGQDRTVQVWTARPRHDPVAEVARLDAKPSALAVSPDGRTLAVGAEDGSVRMLDSGSGREQTRLTGHGGAVTAVAFASAQRLFSGDAQGTVRSWDLPAGRVRRVRAGAHRGAITSMTVTISRLLVTGGADGTVARWRTEPLERAGNPLGPLSSPITDVTVGTDGTTIAASTSHGAVGRWTSAGDLIDSFTVTPDTVWAVALGAGDRLAAARADEVLSLWSLANRGAPRRTRDLGPHPRGALDVAFVDATTIAVGSGDGSVHLWDAASGIPIGPPLAVSDAESAIRHIATARDGRIWTVGQDGVVHRIDALVLRSACDEAEASFDRHQRDRLLAGRPLVACPAVTR
jgi:WD40 repeat protein